MDVVFCDSRRERERGKIGWGRHVDGIDCGRVIKKIRRIWYESVAGRTGNMILN